MLAAPCNPVMLEMPALCTRDAICLQARAMLESTMVSSPSMTPACSFFSNHVVRVVMSYWLFACCLGAAVSAATAALTATLFLCTLTICFPAPSPATEPCSDDPATERQVLVDAGLRDEVSQLEAGAMARVAERIACVVAIAASAPRQRTKQEGIRLSIHNHTQTHTHTYYTTTTTTTTWLVSITARLWGGHGSKHRGMKKLIHKPIQVLRDLGLWIPEPGCCDGLLIALSKLPIDFTPFSRCHSDIHLLAGWRVHIRQWQSSAFFVSFQILSNL